MNKMPWALSIEMMQGASANWIRPDCDNSGREAVWLNKTLACFAPRVSNTMCRGQDYAMPRVQVLGVCNAQ